ncbi:MAG: sugar ABC transporter permease [Clostridia bacterium]|nr:sugar ABC transporter permease [Clostridia bacterium]
MEKAMRKYSPVFVLPTALAFAIGFAVPFALGIYLSMCRFTTVTDASFVGITNFAQIIGDATFTHSLWYTALFTAVSVIVINVAAFAIALALSGTLRGTTFFRTVFFMPNLIGGLVLGYIWQMILNTVFFSLLGSMMNLNEWLGFWGLVIVVAWQQIGYMMIIYIAGLQNVPEELLEAARIDGASRWQTLWRIKLPMVMPSITICSFLTLTNSFKLFDQNLALTAGEPANRSALLALDIYQTFYGRVGWEGVGQAKAVVFCALVVTVALLQLRFTRRKEVQR